MEHRVRRFSLLVVFGAIWVASSACTRTLDVLTTRDGSAPDAASADAAPRDARPAPLRDSGPPARDLGPDDGGRDAEADASLADAGPDAGPGECATPGETITGDTLEVPYATGATVPRITRDGDGFLLLYETDPRVTGGRVPALARFAARAGTLPALAPIHALDDALAELVAVGIVDGRGVAVVRTVDGRLRAWTGSPDAPEDGRVIELDPGPMRTAAGAAISGGAVVFLSHEATAGPDGAFADLRLHEVSLDGTVATPVSLELSFASASRDARIGVSAGTAWISAITGRTVTYGLIDPSTGGAVGGEGTTTAGDVDITGYSVATAFSTPALLLDRGSSVELRYPDGSEYPVAVAERETGASESRLGSSDFALVAAIWITGRRAPVLRAFPSFGGAPAVDAPLDETAVGSRFVRGLGLDIAETLDIWAVAYGARVSRDDGSEEDRLYLARVRFCVPLGGA